MSKKPHAKDDFSRRDFLKAFGLGACSLYLAGATGCTTPETGEEISETTAGTRKGFFKPLPSPWFEQVNAQTVQCTLCPKACVLSEGDRSPCRVRENHNGSGVTLSYGNPALVQEDPIERKPFYHVMPGCRVLSLSTVGCNLACKFCEVWDMALVHPEEVHAYDMPPEQVIDYAQASGVQALSYAFGEPVIFYEYMMAIAGLAKEAGLLNVIHSAGYIQEKPLLALCENIDAANIDLKSFDPAFYEEIVGGRLEPVLETLKILRQHDVHIEITNLVIPTLNDDIDTIRKMCDWIVEELGDDIPLHFARFYPLYKLSALPRTAVATLEQARSAAMDAGLKHVYIAKVVGHEGENTICPTCGEVVIKRLGFVIDEIQIENGQCTYCQSEIAGRWA